MSDIALTVSILALVAVVGLFIGNVKFRGIGLGIGGVLFGGIIVGHFVSQAGMTLSSDMLHVIQEFGLILFVYTIGIQVGPGFFASLRVSGLRLNLFAVLIVIIGGLVTAILHKLFDIPLLSAGDFPVRLPIRQRWGQGSRFCATWVHQWKWSIRWG